jgi:hypothetical protein
MSDPQTAPLQNDPDRATGSLVPDAQGEFVTAEPGGAFDPRSFRGDGQRPTDEDPGSSARAADAAARPPVDDERMSGPGEEIDKAG